MSPWCFPGGSDGKESACYSGDLGSIPGSGRSPGKENGNPLQCSCLENPHRQGSLVGYSPWGQKEWTWLTNTFFHLCHLGPYPTPSSSVWVNEGRRNSENEDDFLRITQIRGRADPTAQGFFITRWYLLFPNDTNPTLTSSHTCMSDTQEILNSVSFNLAHVPQVVSGSVLHWRWKWSYIR